MSGTLSENPRKALLTLLDMLPPDWTASERQEVRHFIDVDEYGLALETLVGIALADPAALYDDGAHHFTGPRDPYRRRWLARTAGTRRCLANASLHAEAVNFRSLVRQVQDLKLRSAAQRLGWALLALADDPDARPHRSIQPAVREAPARRAARVPARKSLARLCGTP